MKRDFASLKVAVVHDWLTVYAGAEKVLEQILEIWPHADLFAVCDFFPEKHRASVLKGKTATTSFIQRLPFAETRYRSYLPLMPIAIEQFDLSGYDLVISSSSCVAKGVITGPDQLHVSYVHSPIRYAWDLQHQYLKEANLVRGLKSFTARIILHYMRLWDYRTAAPVDTFAANSHFIAKRIKKLYGRDAAVIYPPVDINKFTIKEEKSDFYVTASRLVPYKCIRLIIEAFNEMPEKKLVVVGDGPEFASCKGIAGDNIEMVGHQPADRLVSLMQNAKAFVFAAKEDFGIAPVEAQACGTPVIAFGQGGSLETVVEDSALERRTGIFFHEQSAASIVDAVQRFERELSFSARACRANAERFSNETFKQKLVELAKRSWCNP